MTKVSDNGKQIIMQRTNKRGRTQFARFERTWQNVIVQRTPWVTIPG